MALVKPKWTARDGLMTKLRALPLGLDKDTETTTFRIPRVLLKDLREIAKHRGVSVNRLVVPMLEWARDEYVAEYGAPGDKERKR